MAWFPVRLSADGRTGTALTHNVSREGMLLAARQSIDVGSTVKLSVHIDPEGARSRELEGRIVRMVPNAADPGGLWPYKLAIAFENADPELVELVVDGS